MQPFRPGDRIALKWGKRRGPSGTVIDVYEPEYSNVFCAVVLDDGRRMVYPASRMIPIGTTALTLRHVFSMVADTLRSK